MFELYESEVRSYCRSFPGVFARGEGSYLYDRDGRGWLDFLCGAGALNYGHNHPVLKGALLRYIERNGLVSSLDLHTGAKEEFLTALNDVILRPRGLRYRCQFCGPTGTNAVEAALRLARKATRRAGVIAFTNSYHGMSAGAMAVTSSYRRRDDRHVSADRVTFVPFEGFTGEKVELGFVRRMLTGKGSGIGLPAAIIVELVQGEGGVNVASTPWVREIAALAKELGAVLIVDDIQAGCGRSGRFFSFEHHGIVPDLVCLSKSISGYGLPMSVVLIDPALDVWEPGEHTGTFRGFTYGFVTGAQAFRHFWSTPSFARTLAVRAGELGEHVRGLLVESRGRITAVRQLGLIVGIEMIDAGVASAVQRACFARGLIVETCGPGANTIKLLPPLTVGAEELGAAVEILSAAIRGDA